MNKLDKTRSLMRRTIFSSALALSISLNIFAQQIDARDSTILTLDEKVRRAVSDASEAI